MALDGCGQLCKCILILVNIVFGMLGLGMLALGLWLRFSSQTEGFFKVDLNTQQFVIGVTVLIVLGGLMLLIAVFGDYGACSESRSALTVFSALLALLAGLEIGAGVMAFAYKDDVGEQVSVFYKTVYLQYVNKLEDPSMGVTLTLIHNMFKCCGLTGQLLEPLVRKTCPDAGFFETFTIPSCPAEITSTFHYKGMVILGGFVGIATLMICAAVLSSILRCSISRSTCSSPPYILLASQPFTSPVVSVAPDPSYAL